MTYQSREEIPATVRDVLPPDAQDLYLARYNEAWEMYEEDRHRLPRDSFAHQAAWAAVTREFVQDEKSGTWYRQGEEPSEDEEEKGLLDKLKYAFS